MNGNQKFSTVYKEDVYKRQPVCCAAALAEVNELLDRDLAGNAKKVGDYFAAKLEKLPHVKEVRHQGDVYKRQALSCFLSLPL